MFRFSLQKFITDNMQQQQYVLSGAAEVLSLKYVVSATPGSHLYELFSSLSSYLRCVFVVFPLTIVADVYFRW